MFEYNYIYFVTAKKNILDDDGDVYIQKGTNGEAIQSESDYSWIVKLGNTTEYYDSIDDLTAHWNIDPC